MAAARLFLRSLNFPSFRGNAVNTIRVNARHFRISSFSSVVSPFRPRSTAVFVFGGFGVAAGLYATFHTVCRANTPLALSLEDKDQVSRDVHKLHLTLYQYQNCPFCGKVRAFLDYYGFDYKVVEVNPLWKTELKFSQCKKVPIIIAERMQASEYTW